MGYRNTTFHFMDDGKKKPINLLFAPNGCGKSSVLTAIDLCYCAPRLIGYEGDLLMRKLVFDEDYDPHYDHLKETKIKHEMRVKADFISSSGKTATTELFNNGVISCTLPHPEMAYRIDADNPMNVVRFQFPFTGKIDEFLNVANIVFNYKCTFDPGKSTQVIFSELENEIDFYTDFIIEKYNVKSHFKSMSGGEKKLATMLSQIFDGGRFEAASAIIIDSFEKEIYYKRQTKAIDKILEYFPDKQFFVVTHSETLIKHVRKRYGKECLYDIEKYKSKELNIKNYKN